MPLVSVLAVVLVKRSKVAGIGNAVLDELLEPFLKLPSELKLLEPIHEALSTFPIMR